jgi:hypothetical protein
MHLHLFFAVEYSLLERGNLVLIGLGLLGPTKLLGAKELACLITFLLGLLQLAFEPLVLLFILLDSLLQEGDFIVQVFNFLFIPN